METDYQKPNMCLIVRRKSIKKMLLKKGPYNSSFENEKIEARKFDRPEINGPLTKERINRILGSESSQLYIPKNTVDFSCCFWFLIC